MKGYVDLETHWKKLVNHLICVEFEKLEKPINKGKVGKKIINKSLDL